MSKLLYAQVREDPEADIEALGIGPEDRLLAVTSGGCTALRLLAEDPRELICVDFNPAQNHLLELKLAAIKFLPLAECRCFLGARKAENRLAMYRSFIAAALSPAARTFWEHRPQLIEKGVLYAGRTERVSILMRKMLFGYIHKPLILRQLLRQNDLASQADFYRDVWANKRWRLILRVAFNPWVFRVIYGRRFTERLGSQDLTQLWMEKVENAFTRLPIQSNYLLSQLFWGRFLPGEDGLPPYLRQGIFEKVRANADRISWVTGDIVSVLRESPEGAFTKVTLSNAFEWIPQQLLPHAFESLGHAVAPHGRIVMRHLLGVTPVPFHAPLEELTGLSDCLTQKDMAVLYTRVSVYERV
jgi:S-adenosylmethionine:diacylglycerol 3-amino-3-carboxypropyl transferase